MFYHRTSCLVRKLIFIKLIKNRQIYKGVDGSIKRGVGVTDISGWWKGLAKELELDIESIDEKKDESSF
jgi:hypothetical protein